MSAVFNQATRHDFLRMLGNLLQTGKDEVGKTATQVEAQFVKAGAIGSGRLFIAIEDAIRPAHDKTIGDAMRLTHDLAVKIDCTIDELLGLAQTELSMFNEYCLERIGRIKGTPGLDQILQAARERVQQRLANAQQDLKIGFINKKVVAMSEPPDSQARALRLLKVIYETTHDREEPVFVAELADQTALGEQETQAAWRYLRDRGLIQTYSIPYTARINASGIDAIEKAQRNPDQPSTSFPAATYNFITNTVNVGTAINSPMQQAGPHATQHQVITYNEQQLGELRQTLELLKAHFDDLRLDASTSKRARAQIATLDAQLDTDPDPVILRQAGRTLRNITEGTIGGLIATAVQPTVWMTVAEVLHRLFA